MGHGPGHWWSVGDYALPWNPVPGLLRTRRLLGHQSGRSDSCQHRIPHLAHLVSSPNDSAPYISLGVGEQSKQLLNGPVGLFSALNLGVFIQGTLFPLTKAISHIAFKTGSTWRVLFATISQQRSTRYTTMTPTFARPGESAGYSFLWSALPWRSWLTPFFLGGATRAKRTRYMLLPRPCDVNVYSLSLTKLPLLFTRSSMCIFSTWWPSSRPR